MHVLQTLLLVSCVMISMPSSATADEERLGHGTIVGFRNATTQQERKFAEEQIIIHFRDEDGPLFDDSMSGWRFKLADIDLNDDGILERMVVINENYWCGSAGCQGLLLRREGVRWSLITRPTISEEKTIILDENVFGYSKLYTGGTVYTFKDGIVHEMFDVEANESIK